jgi:alpha,alpha-trehalase
VDGKPRYDGVRDFLLSRGIDLPLGNPSDPPEAETVCGLGNRKNDLFNAEVREHGVETFPSTIEVIHQLHEAGIRTGLMSSSKNTAMVLDVTGTTDLFEVRVDGVVAAEVGLPGKPDPAMYLEAARRMGVDAARSVVVEDALSGVEAGRRGGFGLVIGVDRLGQAAALRAAGADVVVDDLAEVGVGA